MKCKNGPVLHKNVGQCRRCRPLKNSTTIVAKNTAKTYLHNTIGAKKSIDAKIGNINVPLKIRQYKHHFKYE
jgi:hypothetical protein